MIEIQFTRPGAKRKWVSVNDNTTVDQFLREQGLQPERCHVFINRTQCVDFNQVLQANDVVGANAAKVDGGA